MGVQKTRRLEQAGSQGLHVVPSHGYGLGLSPGMQTHAALPRGPEQQQDSWGAGRPARPQPRAGATVPLSARGRAREKMTTM